MTNLHQSVINAMRSKTDSPFSCVLIGMRNALEKTEDGLFLRNEVYEACLNHADSLPAGIVYHNILKCDKSYSFNGWRDFSAIWFGDGHPGLYLFGQASGITTNLLQLFDPTADENLLPHVRYSYFKRTDTFLIRKSRQLNLVTGEVERNSEWLELPDSLIYQSAPLTEWIFELLVLDFVTAIEVASERVAARGRPRSATPASSQHRVMWGCNATGDVKDQRRRPLRDDEHKGQAV